jgi:FMN phosphatase YigB (HAD superfamily)
MAKTPQMTAAQQLRLDTYNNQHKLIAQRPDGSLKIEIYGSYFLILPDGKVIGAYKTEAEDAKIKMPKYITAPKSVSTQSIQIKKAELKKPEVKKAESSHAWGEYEYSSYKPASQIKEHSYYDKTFCQLEPECCKPREIKMVAWDADHTIWNMGVTAAAVTGPLKKIDDDTVVELREPYKQLKLQPKDELEEIEMELTSGLSKQEQSKLLGIAEGKQPEATKEQNYRTVIKLFPTFRKTLDELEKRKIPSVIISLNTPGSVKRILKEFGLLDRFAEVRDSYDNKGKVYNEITRKSGICPCSGIFVDDNMTNIRDVSAKQGMALQIGKSGDIQEPIDIMPYIL